MKNYKLFNIYLLALIVSFAAGTYAEKSTLGKPDNVSQKEEIKPKKNILRKTTDKLCAMLNGKMQCKEQARKPRANTLQDKVEENAAEPKDHRFD